MHNIPDEIGRVQGGMAIDSAQYSWCAEIYKSFREIMCMESIQKFT